MRYPPMNGPPHGGPPGMPPGGMRPLLPRGGPPGPMNEDMPSFFNNPETQMQYRRASMFIYHINYVSNKFTYLKNTYYITKNNS